jgi:hypothetical protein
VRLAEAFYDTREESTRYHVLDTYLQSARRHVITPDRVKVPPLGDTMLPAVGPILKVARFALRVPQPYAPGRVAPSRHRRGEKALQVAGRHGARAGRLVVWTRSSHCQQYPGPMVAGFGPYYCDMPPPADGRRGSASGVYAWEKFLPSAALWVGNIGLPLSAG